MIFSRQNKGTKDTYIKNFYRVFACIIISLLLMGNAGNGKEGVKPESTRVYLEGNKPSKVKLQKSSVQSSSHVSKSTNSKKSPPVKVSKKTSPGKSKQSHYSKKNTQKTSIAKAQVSKSQMAKSEASGQSSVRTRLASEVQGTTAANRLGRADTLSVVEKSKGVIAESEKVHLQTNQGDKINAEKDHLSSNTIYYVKEPSLESLDSQYSAPAPNVGRPTVEVDGLVESEDKRKSATEKIQNLKRAELLNDELKTIDAEDEKDDFNDSDIDESGALLASQESVRMKAASPSEIREVSNREGYQYLDHVGPFNNREGDAYYEVGPKGDKMYLTISPKLQEHAVELLKSSRVPLGAIVAIEPSSGKIRALAGYSQNRPKEGQALVAMNTFPAASLFKVITAAAAVETSGLSSQSVIKYRGGTYSLGKHNYLPSTKADKNAMTLSTALAKSCNPAFARVALNNLSVDILTQYANNFGFSKRLALDFPLAPSTLDMSKDDYTFARTAAGFGDAFVSPIHAAVIAAAVGNKGLMMRPYIVDSIADRSGLVKVRNSSQVLEQVILESTAQEVLSMMEATVSEGTGRKQFRSASPQLKRISVASKTGTLSGKNPKGVYHWFIAVAPVENPSLAIATLVIDDGTARINGVGLGKKFYEKYFHTNSLQ
jgi:peptidoglycan glycosyltransferase